MNNFKTSNNSIKYSCLLIMGCGPCGASQSVVEPQRISIPIITIEKKVSNMIDQYIKLSEKELHPILNILQCEQVKDYLASHSTLPDLCQKNSGKKQNPGQPNNENQQFLLTNLQRIVWKCLLVIPFYHPSDKNTHAQSYHLQKIAQKSENSFYQISLDVNRTFPSYEKINRQALERVLQNLASCYPVLGYTQGMNYYAGFLLLCGFCQEQVFHLLTILFISRQYFFAHNFHDTFFQALTAGQILSQSIDENMKQLLENNQITEQLYSFQWFLCCFLITLKPEVSVIIWDKMIKLGYEGLTRKQEIGGISFITTVGFEIMQNLKAQILQKNTPDGILNILRADNLKNRIYVPQIRQIIKKIQQKMKKTSFLSKPKKQMVITRSKFLEKDDKLTQILQKKQTYQDYIAEIKGQKLRQ